MTLPPLDEAALERRTMRKVQWRLLPLLCGMFLVNSMDRVNVSFAALTMNDAIGLTTLSYAWGAGIFFIAYFLFEVPSNLIMERVGARVWMTRIMISWGLVSGATAFITGETSFLVVRFLLGAAEAGLVPGILLYIAYWFPSAYRARAIAIFLLAAPLSFVIVGFLSTPILALDGAAGLAGWQWMFLIEAVPTLLLGVMVFLRLPDTPQRAPWLAADERDWLERHCAQPAAHAGVLDQLRLLLDRRVALLAAIYFGRTTAMYGISLFLPLVVKGMGLSNAQTGPVAALPFIAATIGCWLWARSSDRHGERHWHTILTMLLAAGGLAAAGAFGTSAWSLLAISVAAVGLYAQPASFWPLPASILSGAAAAAGIAMINATGNLGGLSVLTLFGWTQGASGSYAVGLYLMAGFAASSALLGLWLKRLGWERPA